MCSSKLSWPLHSNVAFPSIYRSRSQFYRPDRHTDLNYQHHGGGNSKHISENDQSSSNHQSINDLYSCWNSCFSVLVFLKLALSLMFLLCGYQSLPSFKWLLWYNKIDEWQKCDEMIWTEATINVLIKYSWQQWMRWRLFKLTPSPLTDSWIAFLSSHVEKDESSSSSRTFVDSSMACLYVPLVSLFNQMFEVW